MFSLLKLFSENTPYYSLEQNSPNPCTATTIIRFSIAKTSHVQLKLYDGNGNEVMSLVDESRIAGKYAVAVDAGYLQAGVYYYKLISGSYSAAKQLEIRKMSEQEPVLSTI
jgi:ribosome biogenesis protein Tsr3